MDWGEVQAMRGATVTDLSGEPVGTLDGPYMLEGRLRGWAVTLNSVGRRATRAHRTHVVVGEKHMERVADRRFRIDAPLDDALVPGGKR